MDVITRTEFDAAMKNFATKDDLSEVVSVVKETINDLKVDLFAQVEEKVTRSYNLLLLDVAKRSDLKDGKNEILATFRRNIGEAIEPLKSEMTGLTSEMTGLKSEVTGLKSEVTGLKSDVTGLKSDVAALRLDMDHGFLKMGARIDEMQDQIKVVAEGHAALDAKLTHLCGEMRESRKHHERILDRHDADLYKLRQSGVLQ